MQYDMGTEVDTAIVGSTTSGLTTTFLEDEDNHVRHRRLTVRTANAVVENHMYGVNLAGVTLTHKYSDDYVDQKTWGNLPARYRTPSLRVTYHTGLFTTGRDWWHVSFYSEDFTIYCYTDPNNFRGIVDGLETAAPVIAAAAAAYATAGAATPAAVAAAAAAGEAITNSLTTKGATAGFKQHILRSEDQGNTVRLILQPRGRATISSPSGRSDTVFRCQYTGQT